MINLVSTKKTRLLEHLKDLMQMYTNMALQLYNNYKNGDIKQSLALFEKMELASAQVINILDGLDG